MSDQTAIYSGLRCKSGEVAVITRVPHSEIESTRLGLLKLIGKFVRVTTLCAVTPLPSWNIEEPFMHTMMHGIYAITEVEDWCLTPMRGLPLFDETGTEAFDPLRVALGINAGTYA